MALLVVLSGGRGPPPVAFGRVVEVGWMAPRREVMPAGSPGTGAGGRRPSRKGLLPPGMTPNGMRKRSEWEIRKTAVHRRRGTMGNGIGPTCAPLWAWTFGAGGPGWCGPGRPGPRPPSPPTWGGKSRQPPLQQADAGCRRSGIAAAGPDPDLHRIVGGVEGAGLRGGGPPRTGPRSSTRSSGLDAAADPGGLPWPATVSLSITEIAARTGGPDRVIGPAHLHDPWLR